MSWPGAVAGEPLLMWAVATVIWESKRVPVGYLTNKYLQIKII